MENLLSIKKKSFFPGLTLLLAGFLAGMLIPNFIYRFSWKQQAFSAVYLFGNLWEKTEAGGIDYLLQILWMRGGIFFFLSLICGFTVFGVPMAIMAMLFYRDWTGNRIFHVYSAVRTYRRRSCRSTSFSALSDLSAIMGFGVSDGLQGIYGNLAQSWNFSTESKRLSPESALIYSFIRCGNSFGMACKSMDFKQNSGFFEIF